MKRLYFTAIAAFFALLCFSQSVQAQNYQAVYPNRLVNYFDHYDLLNSNDGEFLFINTDTVINAAGGEIYLNFSDNFIFDRPFCFECNEICISGSLFGKVMTAKPNGDNLFYNRWGDSIVIPTLANVGDTHYLVKTSDTTYLQTILENEDERAILGVVDTVKVFKLQERHISGDTVSSVFNGDSIVLSKNYGLIDMFMVPDFPFNYYAGRVKLSGIKNPAMGLSDITGFQMYDYDVGDEYHYATRIINFGTYSGDDRILFILSKDTSLPNKITYQAREIKLTTASHQTRLTSDSLINFTIENTSLFEPIPGIGSTSGLIKSFLYSGGVYIERVENFMSGQFFNFGDSCYVNGHENYYTSVWRNEVGIGFKDRNTTNWGISMTDIYERIVYYKKGQTEWGTRINYEIYMGIDEKQIIHAAVYPNPANEQIEVEIDKESLLRHKAAGLNFQITDLVGRVVSVNEIDTERNNISISQLPSGIYHWRIAASGITLQQGRIVKQ